MIDAGTIGIEHPAPIAASIAAPLMPEPSRSALAAQLAIFLVAAVMLIPAVTPGEAAGGGALIKLAFVARIAALVVFAHVMLRRRSLGWPQVGLSQPAWGRFLVALPAGAVMTVLFGAVARALSLRLGLSVPDYSMFAPIRGSLGEYLFWLLPVSVGTAAFGEELIFRGFLTDGLRRLLGRSGSLVVAAALAGQALLFGSLHFYQGAGGMIAAGVTGLALGLTWLIAGRNLWAGIVLHALLDGSAMTALYFGYAST